MKKINRILSITVMSVSIAAVLTGCSAALHSSASSNDGMYGIHDRVQIANRQREAAELRQAEANARRAELEARIAEAQVHALENDYYDYQSGDYSYSSVLADTYESAYMRRLNGFRSASYRMPSSYFNLRYGGAFNYVTAYDPAFYNVMVSGDQVWVEPKYISSMFGTWGATNVSIGISVFPYSWYYGWRSPYYGSWWGYPRYSWYDWNWGIRYNPYTWWGYGYGWGPSWGHGWHYGWNQGWRPGRYPSHAVRPQPHRQSIINSRPSTRYQSPSSGGNYAPGKNGSGNNRGTINGSGTFRPNNGQSGGSRNNSGTPTRNNNNNTNTRNNSNSGSYNNNRGGSSSFFNNNSGSRSQSQSSGSSGGSRSGGYSGGGSSSGGGRGNSIGR